MGILTWIVLGVLIGWLTGTFLKKYTTVRIDTDIYLGIAGALAGGFLVSLIGGWNVLNFNILSFLMALLGSVLFIAAINLRQIKTGKPQYHYNNFS